MTPQAERKREISISNQVANMLARRAAEQERCAELLLDIDTRLAALNARRAEVLTLMGVSAPEPLSNGHAPEADPLRVKCADCGGGVDLAAPGALPKECPYCTASPFECAR